MPIDPVTSPSPHPLADRLVTAASDAISEEMRRQLSGEPPTGGHGYYAEGIVAVVAVLRALDAAVDEFLIAGEDLPRPRDIAAEIESGRTE